MEQFPYVLKVKTFCILSFFQNQLNRSEVDMPYGLHEVGRYAVFIEKGLLQEGFDS